MNKGIRILQYGDSGVGKSIRASTAAAWGPVEFMDFDEQGSNIQRYLSASDPARLAKIKITSFTGMENGQKIDYFANRVKELVGLRKAGKQPDIATLVIDSYTTLEQLYAEYIFTKYTPSATGFGSARSSISIGKEELILPGTMDYSVLAVVMKKVFESLKNTGINIIMNCHAKDPLEQKGHIIRQGTIKAAGQIRDMMPTEFNEFHYLFVDSTNSHRVQAKPSSMWLAKTSLPSVANNGILSSNSLKIFDDWAFKLNQGEK